MKKERGRGGKGRSGVSGERGKWKCVGISQANSFWVLLSQKSGVLNDLLILLFF